MNVSVEHLSLIAWLVATAHGALAFFLMAKPEQLAAACRAFPRNTLAGVALAVLTLLWASYLVSQMTLGELGKYKQLLYLLTPLSIFLVVRYLDELLAARAFGGLLLLLPTVMTDSARWHPSAWRLVIVCIAYAWVIAGMWIVLSPFKFRIWTTWLLATHARRLISGIIAGLVAAASLITGIVAA